MNLSRFVQKDLFAILSIILIVCVVDRSCLFGENVWFIFDIEVIAETSQGVLRVERGVRITLQFIVDYSGIDVFGDIDFKAFIDAFISLSRELC